MNFKTILFVFFIGLLPMLHSCDSEYDDTLRAGEAFLKANAKNDSVQRTSSGLQYKVVYNNASGSYLPIDIISNVKLNYTCTFIDGTVYYTNDTVYYSNDTIPENDSIPSKIFSYDGLDPGIREILKKTKVGSLVSVWAPYKLGKGANGIKLGSSEVSYEIDPYTVLCYKIEVLGFN